jgi:hypothetical protein
MSSSDIASGKKTKRKEEKTNGACCIINTHKDKERRKRTKMHDQHKQNQVMLTLRERHE